MFNLGLESVLPFPLPQSSTAFPETGSSGLMSSLRFLYRPTDYHNPLEVFSKARATSPLPHRPHDCAIDLPPGTTPPRGRLHSLSGPETKAMGEYIEESLATGAVRPSASPAGAGFFFVEKDKPLRSCIDYRGLNDITSKNCYSLPLISSAFEPLQEATIFFTSWIFGMPTTWFGYAKEMSGRQHSAQPSALIPGRPGGLCYLLGSISPTPTAQCPKT